MKDYLKVEGYLADDNFEFIEKEKYFEDLNVWQVVRFLYVIIEVGFRVLMGQANLHYNGHNSFKNNSPTSYYNFRNFLLGKWKKIMLIYILNMHNLCMYL
jgi:hypothetical protein